MTTQEILISLVLNVIAGFFVVLAIYLLQIGRYYYSLGRIFNNAKFDVYRKYNSKPIGELTCTVKGNIINFIGKGNGKDPWDGPYYGESLMNPITLRIGEGFHFHITTEGFNFLKMVIRDDNTILVESTYVYTRLGDGAKPFPDNMITIPQALIWKRQSATKR